MKLFSFIMNNCTDVPSRLNVHCMQEGLLWRINMIIKTEINNSKSHMWATYHNEKTERYYGLEPQCTMGVSLCHIQVAVDEMCMQYSMTCTNDKIHLILHWLMKLIRHNETNIRAHWCHKDVIHKSSEENIGKSTTFTIIIDDEIFIHHCRWFTNIKLSSTPYISN